MSGKLRVNLSNRHDFFYNRTMKIAPITEKPAQNFAEHILIQQYQFKTFLDCRASMVTYVACSYLKWTALVVSRFLIFPQSTWMVRIETRKRPGPVLCALLSATNIFLHASTIRFSPHSALPQRVRMVCGVRWLTQTAFKEGGNKPPYLF